jgi:apolipoprotein N-acyltransferase
LQPRSQAAAVAESRPGQHSVRVVTPICFEDAVSPLVRRMIYDERGHKRADVIVNLTNDGWFAGRHQRYQHLQIAVLRSIENRVPTARSVNTGVSGFIDSAGRIGPLVRVDGRAVLVDGFAVQGVMADSRHTLFGRVGSIPVFILLGCSMALIALAALRSRTTDLRPRL